MKVEGEGKRYAGKKGSGTSKGRGKGNGKR